MDRYQQIWPLFRDAVLHSYSMVFFNLRRWFAFLLIAVTFFDPVAGFSGLFSVALVNTLALAMGYKESLIKNGDLGFNALLVGLGLGAFYEWGLPLVILLALAAVLTLIITLVTMGVLSKYHLPFLSLPFVLSLWTLILASQHFEALGVSQRRMYLLNELYAVGDNYLVNLYHYLNGLTIPMAVRTYLRSLGAILFQYNILTGAVLSVALFFYSRMAFLLSLIGFFTAWFFYQFIGADLSQLNYSYIGFNYILSAIAIGGIFFVPSRSAYLWVIFLIPILSILSSSFAHLLAAFQLPLYALPFNIVVLSFIYALKWRSEAGAPEEVRFQTYVPEHNYYNHLSTRQRFRNYRALPIGLPVIGEWYVAQGHGGEITHREGWRHAWDFTIRDVEGREHENAGTRPEDYFCYGTPVVAPADGTVAELVDHIPDNPVGETNLVQNWGNSIVIDHGYALYSQLSHLRPDSFKVKKGDFVKKGQMLAECGNSGRSPEPHLHFQLQSRPEVGAPTLDYPISMYLARAAVKGADFHFYGIPAEGSFVQAVLPQDIFRYAFYFVPGKRLQFRVNDRDTTTWECFADPQNRSYIENLESGARAYLENNGYLHYFTEYRGRTDDLLFHFFQAAYFVVFHYQDGMQLKDTFSLQQVERSPLRWLQDLVAPFVRFMSVCYEMNYLEGGTGPAADTIRLETVVSRQFPGRKQQKAVYEITLKDHHIDRFEVRSGRKKIVAVWMDEKKEMV